MFKCIAETAQKEDIENKDKVKVETLGSNKGKEKTHTQQRRQQRNFPAGGVLPQESVTTASSDMGNAVQKYSFCVFPKPSSRTFFTLSFLSYFCFFFGLFYIFSSKELHYQGCTVQNTNRSFFFFCALSTKEQLQALCSLISSEQVVLNASLSQIFIILKN